MKTLDELKSEFAFSHNSDPRPNLKEYWGRDVDDEEVFTYGLYAGFGAGFIESQRWISVDEELPKKEEYDWVLVKIQEIESGIEYIPHIAELRGDGFWHTTDSDNCGIRIGESFEQVQRVKVTHWRPIERT